MRSLKLLASAAILAALIAGPVMAQDAMAPVANDTTATAPATAAAPVKAAKHSHKKTTAKKHSHKKAAATTSTTK